MKACRYRDMAFVTVLSMLFALKLAVTGAVLSAIAFSAAVHFDPTASKTLPLIPFLMTPALFWIAGVTWFVRMGMILSCSAENNTRPSRATATLSSSG